jgi:hypothetical protein
MSTGRLGAGDTAIQPTIFDAKADLLTATAADTPARLAVGSNNQVLTADSSTATGLKWATPAAASYTWTSYTPTFTNLTVGNGTLDAKYLRIDNKLMFVRLQLDFGSTTSISGSVWLSLPSGSTSSKFVPTTCWYNDSGTASYTGVAYTSVSDTNIYLGAIKSDSTYTTVANLSSTVPMTWATNDSIRFLITYEEA